jgi:hypothetical protein
MVTPHVQRNKHKFNTLAPRINGMRFRRGIPTKVVRAIGDRISPHSNYGMQLG